MGTKEANEGHKKGMPGDSASEQQNHSLLAKSDGSVANILDERIVNLREAIAEIDEALAGRKQLNARFLEQIGREAEEVKRHLNALQPPWRIGYDTQYEFFRLSLHKSLTSRAKERRSEELRYWENGVNLMKERRKFVDELKSLLAMKERLAEDEH